MKKIKLITSALIGISALGLSGCGHQHTFDSKWESNNDEHWHPATCEHAGQVVSEQGKHSDNNGDGKCDICDRILSTHSHSFSADWKSDDSKHWKECVCGAKDQEAVHVDADHNGKCDVCEHDVEIVPAVTNVTVALEAGSIFEGESTTASANVTAFGGADPTVTWSSSDPNVATVDEEGNVLAIKQGSAKIIATSNFDQSKKGEATLIVEEDKGFDPSWIDKGFTYSKEFPVAQIKSFLGSGSYEIVSPSSLEGGCYYIVTETESGTSVIEVVVDGVVYEDYAFDLLDSGFAEDRVYYTSYGVEAVDPTKIYTVSMSCNMDEDTYEDVAPTFIDFFKSSDVWEDDTLTDDTDWSLTHIGEDLEDYEDIIKSYLAGIPFVKMGAKYEINFVDNSFLRAFVEMLGGDPDEYPDQFYICDYTLRDNAFDGYSEILKGEGFEELTDDYGVYYVKNSGIDEFVIYTGFGEGGNTLYCEKNPAILDAWPSEAIASYVNDVVESKYSVPTYDKTTEAMYMMSLLEDEDGAYAEIDVSEAARTEFDAYVDALSLDGYDVEMSEAEGEYPNFYATKGKICFQGYFVENYDESTKTYDPDNGSLVFYLYGDDSRHEDPGIYLPESMMAVLADGSFILPLEVVDLDSPELIAISSKEEIATVEVTVDGVKVTPVAGGETTIQVTVNKTTYTASTVLTVSEKSLLQIELEKANAVFAELGAEVLLELPDISSTDAFGDYDEEDGNYQIALYTDVTEDEYAGLLEDAGFEMSVDEWGYPIAEKDGYRVEPWNYDDGILLIDIYLGSSPAGGQIFDVDDLEDGAEICITCLDAGVGIGAYNGKKNFGSVELGDTFDGCTVFVLEDNGDGTWGLFDEDGNQYGADSGKNIKTSGSGVSFDWTIEIDEYGDATLSCAGWQLMYNNNPTSGGVFKTYKADFLETDGLPVQLFFADGTPGGGGGETDKSAEDLMSELADNLFEDPTAYEYEDDCYLTGCNWGTTSAYTLLEAVEEASYYLPEEFVYEVDAPYEDTWDDGDQGAFATYCTENDVYCEIGAYVSGSNVVVQFAIYEY